MYSFSFCAEGCCSLHAPRLSMGTFPTGSGLWVPNWLSTSCDLGVFVYETVEQVAGSCARLWAVRVPLSPSRTPTGIVDCGVRGRRCGATRVTPCSAQGPG